MDITVEEATFIVDRLVKKKLPTAKRNVSSSLFTQHVGNIKVEMRIARKYREVQAIVKITIPDAYPRKTFVAETDYVRLPGASSQAPSDWKQKEQRASRFAMLFMHAIYAAGGPVDSADLQATLYRGDMSTPALLILIRKGAKIEEDAPIYSHIKSLMSVKDFWRRAWGFFSKILGSDMDMCAGIIYEIAKRRSLPAKEARKKLQAMRNSLERVQSLI